MRRCFEKIVEGLLACSGFVTSLTIVLIVLFLFSEALGLFGSKVVEDGYVLALTGSGVQTYDLYTNGQFYQTQRAEFS